MAIVEGVSYRDLHQRASLAALRAPAVVPIYTRGGDVLVGPVYVAGASDMPCLGCLEYQLTNFDSHAGLAVSRAAAGARIGASHGLDIREARDLLVDVVFRSGGDRSGGRAVVGTLSGECVGVGNLTISPLCRLGGHVATCVGVEGPRAAGGDADLLVPGLRGGRFASAQSRRDMIAMSCDSLFGPVVGPRRFESISPGVLSGSVVPPVKNAGWGRKRTSLDADFVGVLEALERMSSLPYHDNAVVRQIDGDERCLGPADLGGYHEDQYTHSSSRISADAPEEWVAGWGMDGARVWVPAEVGFYSYFPEYGIADMASVFDAERTPLRRYEESSSGSATGATYGEACTHALLEVVERHAFMSFWYSSVLLPRIPSEVLSGFAREVEQWISNRGHEVSLLLLSSPYPIISVACVSFNARGEYPAVILSAASGLDFDAVCETALWEMTNMVGGERTLSESEARARLISKWDVMEAEDHIAFWALPERAPFIRAKCRGSLLSEGEVEKLRGRRGAGSRLDALSALSYLISEFPSHDLGAPVFVDQTNVTIGALGVSCVKCIVPGALGVSFGFAHQRVAELRVLERLGRSDLLASTDDLLPHPFP
ncbi:hypothetical protein C5D07_08555 [Rathayibacter tritici]|uniref:YcaO-like family protein n=1 Tax=Rathayibacter tritici TaxID=33888 RepID=UPI000CE777A1|nr:YcaO-like family protein [Rathayibacter tritici]PPF31549.1 hypothetical protein C5C06_02030 [Rathayibacter tritici]PPI14108.1 hypothetical protein C5D07_08555 [Rathayibacter tritici]